MAEDKEIWRDVISGPRWLVRGATSFLKNACWERRIPCKVEIDKGWFSSTLRFEITGHKCDLTALKTAFYGSLREHNAAIESLMEHRR